MTFPFPSVAPVASLSLLFCALFAKSVNYSAIGWREKLCGGREAPQNSLARKRQERPPPLGRPLRIGFCHFESTVASASFLLHQQGYDCMKHEVTAFLN